MATGKSHRKISAKSEETMVRHDTQMGICGCYRELLGSDCIDGASTVFSYLGCSAHLKQFAGPTYILSRCVEVAILELSALGSETVIHWTT